MTTTLLGPQRFTTTLGATVRSLGLDGTIAMINSGWEERESDDAELAGHLDGRGVNLRLYHRMMDVLDKDEHFAAAALLFRDRQDELRAFYGIRLQSAIDAVQAVAHRSSLHDIGPIALAAAIDAVRDVDAWYSAELAGLYRSLSASAPWHESSTIGWHRGEISAVLDDCAGVVIAGGNVRTLLRTLWVFDVAIKPDLPVVAWSAGAMALTDTVLLFHDHAPHGVTAAELLDRGLGRLPGVIALPHAKRRLRLEEHDRMSVLARRFPDHRLTLLDDGTILRFGEAAAGSGGDRPADLPLGTRYLTADGHVMTAGAA